MNENESIMLVDKSDLELLWHDEQNLTDEDVAPAAHSP